MTQKAYAEGMRALYTYTATFQDAEVAKRLHDVHAELAVRINDLLLPVVKGFGSETRNRAIRPTSVNAGSPRVQHPWTPPTSPAMCWTGSRCGLLESRVGFQR